MLKSGLQLTIIDKKKRVCNSVYNIVCNKKEKSFFIGHQHSNRLMLMCECVCFKDF